MKQLLMSLMVGLAIVGGVATSACAQPGGRMIERFDADRDGALSATEIQKMRGTAFDHLDRNGDGVLDAQEQESLSSRFKQMAGQRKNLLQEADTDRNGQLTRAEYLQGPQPFMDQADTDHDGRLTREEIAAAREQFKRQP
jgi:Ca2+-binding EF-hand superfamily protein